MRDYLSVIIKYVEYACFSGSWQVGETKISAGGVSYACVYIYNLKNSSYYSRQESLVDLSQLLVESLVDLSQLHQNTQRLIKG